MTNWSWRALGFDSYSDYINSHLWKEKSEFFLRLKPKCEECGGEATQVHHKHYRSVCNEKTRDLMSLCSKCHKNIHKNGGGCGDGFGD